MIHLKQANYLFDRYFRFKVAMTIFCLETPHLGMTRLELLAYCFLWLPLSCSTPQEKYSKPLSPKEALTSFQIHPAFRMETFASEPHTLDPVEMVFDANGKIYVVEMPDYPYKPETGQAKSRVRILEDRNGDGVIEESKVFAEGLVEATSALPWNGGLLVCSAPNIFYFRDTNGDDVADQKQILFTGFFANNSEGPDYQSTVWNRQLDLRGKFWPKGPDLQPHVS